MSQMATVTVSKPVVDRAAPATCSLWPSDTMAKPLHIQHVEEALKLEPLLSYVEALNKQSIHSDQELSTDAETETDNESPMLMDRIRYHKDAEGNRVYDGVVISRAERKGDKCRLYNFSRVKKNRKWLKNVLLSDTSSEEDDDDDDVPVTEDELKQMLKEHVQMKRYQKHYQRSKDLRRYQYYSVGLLSNHDMFYDHQKSFTGPVSKKPPVKNKLEKEPAVKENTPVADSKEDEDQLEDDPSKFSGSQSLNGVTSSGGKPNGKVKVKKLTPEQLAARRRRLWVMIAKKEISRAQKQKAAVRKELLACIKKVAKECRKECRRSALLSQKTMKDAATRARRLSKEMQAYWKRFGKVEKEHRRKAEKEALEQRKIDMELREMKRQQRKLNFLITQTELYAHFMARKLTGGTDADRDAILQNFDEPLPANSQQNVSTGAALLSSADDDDYDVEEVKALALSNAEEAYKSHVCQKQAFDAGLRQGQNQRDPNAGESVFANPSISTAAEQPQPTIFIGKLKGYQLKGMNWLANLYDQGINGILADEMGLGKTVQSIAFLAHLAETQGTWGPFLVIAPASTLHNWQQEVTRFVPQFKVIPYWGNTQDRKILRKFWNLDSFSSKDSSFHVVITSYQLVVQDIKYFQRIKWHYMILDEAQAIKSSSSARWKILLSFNCRNRLLLTGTPIQNSMGELWALLHFIMPTMFDSHEEFNEWFSKDIESHVEKQSGLNESQLSRLHMILKPFMLRRVKKDVENELSDKIEVLVYCPLTLRQKLLYQAIKNKISIDDLLLSSTMSTMSQSASSSTSSLMNLVMQFRKVCNHPELFERREVRSAFFMRLPMYCLPKLIHRDGLLDNALPSKRHLLYNKLSIFSSHYIHQSLQKNADASTPWNCFSFSRFINLSPSELEKVMLFGLCVRLLAVLHHFNKSHVLCHRRQFQAEQDGSCFMNQSDFLLDNGDVLSSPNIKSSNVLGELVFCRKLGTMYAHLDHVIESMPETKEHRNIRLRHIKHNHVLPGVTSPSKAHLHHHHVHSSDMLTFQHIERPSVILPCQPTDVPAFLYSNINKISAGYRDYYCCDRSAAWQHDSASRCGSDEARTCLLYGAGTVAEVDWQCSRRHFWPSDIGGLSAVNPKHGYSAISIPDKETLVADAGKLSVLDKLLSRLKAEDHRVLIYSQMTRMIDILEEYLWHRKHSYIRLDGSSKIADRRDMVADFQSRSDIFVFLLSTRAGGLGINLTAADTVIFYDSDWNPTVDQQAMDRAHRLGQTKQVTVYRLICRGTIEERIVERAREKSEIQRMVISGGNFAPDILKPKEVVSLLLDDDEMQRKFQQRQEEKRQKELFSKEKDSERKRKLKPDKPKSGRGPGRRPKLAKSDIETNVTIPAPVDDCTIASIGTLSTPASPYSEMSLVSEGTQLSASIATDDESIDSLVIVDDIQGPSLPGSNPLTTTTIVKRGSGRGRGRPRGSGVGLRSRGPSSIQRSLVAAEEAAATAAKTAAYAAYGYSFNDQNVVSNSSTLSSSSSSADCVASGSLTGSRQQLMRRTLSNGSLPRGSHKSSTGRR